MPALMITVFNLGSVLETQPSTWENVSVFWRISREEFDSNLLSKRW